MKKLIYVFATLIMSIVLAGCGETETESVPGNVQTDSTQKNTEKNSETDSADKGVEENKINQVIVDNDNYKATLLEIVKKSDEIWGNSIEVIYEIENKLNYTIGVQARSVSADGYMVDEATLSMSQEVAAGKKAKAVLTINDFEGYDFPELNSDFEMKLYMFNYDSFEEIAEHDVKVTF